MDKDKEKIAIYIGYGQMCNLDVVTQIGLGCEEESVPYVLVKSDEDDASKISQWVSMQSKLDVGVGIDSNGNLCIHHSKFPDGYYLLPANYRKETIDLRAVGANSARLVKGIPFKEIRA